MSIDLNTQEVVRRGPGRPPKSSIPPYEAKGRAFPESADTPITENSIATYPPQKIQENVSKMEIRRFELADLQAWGNWIFNRLKEQPRYAHLNERMFSGWVRNWIVNNEMLFVRNDGAVALAEICRDSMQPRPWVREVFLYAKEGADADGIELYRFINDWAKQLDSIRFIVGEDSDISLEQIADVIGKVIKRQLSYIKFS